ncbi:MAG: pyruvate kinase alpha/beta domain-containing protein [bacterium]|nr:pyruvate kinase alpha/beta domain-containing protein [bacterium]
MKREVQYFEKTGPENTGDCLEIMQDLVNEGYRNVVVATTSGETGLAAAKRLEGRWVNLAVITHSANFKGPNVEEISQDKRKEIESLGAKIYTGTILTHSLETALAGKFSGVYPTLLIAQTLRRFGEGLKVCCEIVMEAVDAGLIPEGEEVVAVAGTGRGADAVCLIKSAASKRFLDLKVTEILAKPRG